MRGERTLSNFNVDLVDLYLKKEDWRVRENSNISFSLQGLNHYIDISWRHSIGLNE